MHTVGQWVTYLKSPPPDDAEPWGRCTATHSSAGLCHLVPLSFHRSSSTGHPWGQSSPSPSPTPPQPGQRRAAGPRSLPSPVQSPVPHAPEHVKETSTGQERPCEAFVICNGFLGSSITKDVTELRHPLCCGCPLLNKPGEKRHHLLLLHLLIISD